MYSVVRQIWMTEVLSVCKRGMTISVIYVHIYKYTCHGIGDVAELMACLVFVYPKKLREIMFYRLNTLAYEFVLTKM